MPSLDWFAPEHIPACRVYIRARLVDGATATVVGSYGLDGERRWHILNGRALRPMASPIRAWQPLSEAWTWPYGIVPPALASELAGVAAEDLSAAMEEDRAALATAPVAAPAEQCGQWWRDADLVRYEPPGSVTPVHGEARLMRAIAMDRSIRMDMPAHKSQAAALADLRQSLADVLRATPELDWMPQLQPLPQDERDYLTAMGWLVEIGPDRRQMRILLARARTPPVTHEFVGDMLRVSAQRVAQIYATTVAHTVEAANSMAWRTRQRLAVIQERNREACRS